MPPDPITLELLCFLFGFIHFMCLCTVETDASALLSVLHETMDPERIGHNVELTPLHHYGNDNPPEYLWDAVHVKSST